MQKILAYTLSFQIFTRTTEYKQRYRKYQVIYLNPIILSSSRTVEKSCELEYYCQTRTKTKF